jgi:hypothetical protein
MPVSPSKPPLPRKRKVIMEQTEIDKFKLASELLEVLQTRCPYMEKVGVRPLKDILIEKCLVLAEESLLEIKKRTI